MRRAMQSQSAINPRINNAPRKHRTYVYRRVRRDGEEGWGRWGGGESETVLRVGSR